MMLIKKHVLNQTLIRVLFIFAANLHLLLHFSKKKRLPNKFEIQKNKFKEYLHEICFYLF